MLAVAMLFIYAILIIHLYYTRKVMEVRIDEFKKWKRRYYKELETGASIFLKEAEEEIIEDLEEASYKTKFLTF